MRRHDISVPVNQGHSWPFLGQGREPRVHFFPECGDGMNTDQTLSLLRQFDAKGDLKTKQCCDNLLKLISGNIHNKYKLLSPQ